MFKSYPVNLTCSPSLPYGRIMVSADILKNLHLNPGHPLNLCIGNRKVTVCFAGVHRTASTLSLCVADDIRQSLMLPVPITINLAVNTKQDLWRLGPLIGIFANRNDNIRRPFGEQTGFFRKLKSVAHRLNSFCFVFCPRDIDWEKKVIRGSVPPLPGDETTGWVTRVFPFPDVIYDRGLFPKGDLRHAAGEVRKILRKYPGISFFNPGFFGKWKTHRILSKHETLYRYLPETRFCHSIADVHDLLARNGTVYLKPSGGSSGRGIIRLTALPQRYIINLRVAKQVKTLEIKEQAELEKRLQQLIGGQRFIVQQGLKLAKFNGNPFDIRILMQKNRRGVWLRTGMAIRVAGSGNFISNIHAGGQAAKISSILPRVFPQLSLAGNIANDLRRLSSLIASWVTAEYDPLFGEIAIDLGIDESGRVWIIELNAVPGRSVFKRIGAADILDRAISRPMEYAFFLAGFTPRIK